MRRSANPSPNALANRRYRLAHPDRVSAYHKRHYHERGGKEHQQVWYRQHKYGLTQEQFAALWNQNCGCCHSCGRKLKPGTSGHSVDHDHDTGSVRGLLCPQCNLALGLLNEDPVRIRRLADYIGRDTDEGK